MPDSACVGEEHTLLPVRSHVLLGRFNAFTTLGRSIFLPSDTWRLEVLPPARLSDDRFLLHAFAEAPEEALETLTVIDRNFYQRLSQFVLATIALPWSVQVQLNMNRRFDLKYKYSPGERSI